MLRYSWVGMVLTAIAIGVCFAEEDIDIDVADEGYSPVPEERLYGVHMSRKNEENLENELLDAIEEELGYDRETEGDTDTMLSHQSTDATKDLSSKDIYHKNPTRDNAEAVEGHVTAPEPEPELTQQTKINSANDYARIPEEAELHDEVEEGEEEPLSENAEEEGNEYEEAPLPAEDGELNYISDTDDDTYEEALETYNDNSTAYGPDDTPSSQVMREPLVGVGYHVIYGNPEGSFFHGGRDPGLKRTRRIMRLTYNEGKSTILRGTRQRVADQVTFVRVDSCSYNQKSKLIYGTSSYRNKLRSSVHYGYSGSYHSGYWWHWYNYYSFSGSSGYKSVRSQTRKYRKVFLDKTAYCHVGVARYMMESVPYSKNFGVSRHFYHAFLGLPKRGKLTSYYKFLDQWGTHIVVKATVGGRRVDRSRASLESLYDFAERKSRSSVSVSSGSYTWWGHSYHSHLSMNVRSLNRKITSKTQIGKSYTQLAIGSNIDYNKKQHRWQIPAKDTNIPEATKIVIVPISAVCDHVGYWTCIPKASLTNVQIRNLIRKRCANLIKAAKTYAKYLRLKKDKDASLSLPLVWPDGTYGLPKAKKGCPQGEGFDFISGWRKYDTENYRTVNLHSSPIHLDGYFGKNIRQSFCIKRTAKANRKYTRKHWPKGHYCIYKKGDCPVGFKAGYIYWDDENSNNRNAKKGALPDGRYDRNTLIRYCCRHDGSYRDPIALPSSRPFYLLRYGGHCQKVVGMKVRNEFVRWDDENYRTGDSNGGSHPDDKFPDHMLQYCYYYKK